jgi:hypothetical protein
MDIAAIESFGRASGIYAFMNTAWGWPAMESLHYLSIALLIGSVGVFDLRLLGGVRGMTPSALHRLVPVGVAGFSINALTGAMFFVSAPDQYAYNPAFQLKMACVFVAGANVAWFYATMRKPAYALGPSDTAPLALKISAGVSLACWLGVTALGRVITYFRPPYFWCWWCG